MTLRPPRTTWWRDLETPTPADLLPSLTEEETDILRAMRQGELAWMNDAQRWRLRQRGALERYVMADSLVAKGLIRPFDWSTATTDRPMPPMHKTLYDLTETGERACQS